MNFLVIGYNCKMSNLVELVRLRRRVVENYQSHQDGEFSQGPNKYWKVFGGGLVDYDRSLGSVLWDLYGASSFKTLVECKIGEKGTAYVLDVMADTTFLSQLPNLTAGVAVGLTDARSDERKRTEKTKGIDLKPGNIASSATWRNIDEWMVENDIPGFDLIVCRGVGGVDRIPLNLRGYVLQKAWSRLSLNEGILITQVHSTPANEYWVQQMRRHHPEIPVVWQPSNNYDQVPLPAIGLRRELNSPPILPGSELVPVSEILV